METAHKEETEVKIGEKEIMAPPTISDPWELMAQFYESPRYKDSYNNFFDGKEINPEITEKKKEKTFLEDFKARISLVDFATKDVLFKYKPGKYPRRSREALNDYVKVEEDRQKAYGKGVSDDELIALDEYRYKYHQEAANALVRDGIAPTRTLGEAIARLVLIDKGLDSPESAKEKTSEKIKRKLGA